jgi:hypothetical protein
MFRISVPSMAFPIAPQPLMRIFVIAIYPLRLRYFLPADPSRLPSHF